MKVSYQINIWDGEKYDIDDQIGDFGEQHGFLTEALLFLRHKYPEKEWDGEIEEIVEPAETTLKSQG